MNGSVSSGSKESAVSSSHIASSISPSSTVAISVAPGSTVALTRESETGWDRIKSIFQIRYGHPIPEEWKEFHISLIVASCVGFLFGGMMGSRHMGDKFVMLNQSSKFSSTMQFQRQLHSAALLGFVRQGCKWGWKVGLFASIFSGTTILLATYRDKEDSLNIIAAGGLTGGLYRVSWGFLPFLGGTTLGLLISTPLGAVIYAMDKLLVSKKQKLEAREKLFQARRHRENFLKNKLEETSLLIDEMKHGNEGLKNHYENNSHTKRINEGGEGRW